ncbi:MAG: hypothetical protein ACRCYO_18205, partial [Bacteroidia bacterium]
MSDEALSAIGLALGGFIVWIFTWGWAGKILFVQKKGWLLYAIHFSLATALVLVLITQRESSGLAGAIEALFYQIGAIATALIWGILLLVYAKRRAERFEQAANK